MLYIVKTIKYKISRYNHEFGTLEGSGIWFIEYETILYKFYRNNEKVNNQPSYHRTDLFRQSLPEFMFRLKSLPE
jgi:hypothetical protein